MPFSAEEAILLFYLTILKCPSHTGAYIAIPKIDHSGRKAERGKNTLVLPGFYSRSKFHSFGGVPARRGGLQISAKSSHELITRHAELDSAPLKLMSIMS